MKHKKKTQRLLGLMAFGIADSVIAITLHLHAEGQKDINGQKVSALQTATGQYITPTAIPGAVQLPLNPNLSAYPNFVAGEAVRSQLSPDGKTLAIICAG